MTGIKRKHLNQYSSPGANPEATGASEGAEGMCGATQTTGKQEDREFPGEAQQPVLAPLQTCRKREGVLAKVQRFQRLRPELQGSR